MNLHTIFNHKLTPDQIKDAKENLKITEIIDLPTDLKKLWANIPPDKNLILAQHLKPIITYFEQLNSNDFVLVQGDFGAVYYMVNKLKELGFIPIYATTERKIIEEKLSDNSIITKRIFKHICYRKYIE